MLSYIVISLGQNVLGPSMLDLMLIFDGTVADIAWLLPARTCGYAIGSILGK